MQNSFPDIFIIRAQLGKKFELLYCEPIGVRAGGASEAPSLKFFCQFVEGVHVKLQNFNHFQKFNKFFPADLVKL